MNTQKKTQDEKARKRLMEVARSGKSLLPRRAVGGPLMPQDATDTWNAGVGVPDPTMYRNDAKNMANVQAYIKEQGGQVPGQRPTAAGVLEKFQAGPQQAQTGPQAQDPMQQPLTLGGMQSLLGLGTETKKSSAQGYNPGMNLDGSMDKERVSGFGQYVNPPSATLQGYADGGRMPIRSTYDQLRLRGQDVSNAVDRMAGPLPLAQEFAVPQQSAQARMRPAPRQSEGMLGGGMPGMERRYADGGRISGWNVDRAAQIENAVNGAMGQPQAQAAPSAAGGSATAPLLSPEEQAWMEMQRAKEAEQAAAQKPAWKKMLGMAKGGLMPPVWDGREGGEVPPGPDGVDTVPAITQAGPVMLDSNVGEGRQEYVLTPEMVDALGGAGELDVLRKALGGQPMSCGEAEMACGGKRKVPKMAGGGDREVIDPRYAVAVDPNTYRIQDITAKDYSEQVPFIAGTLPDPDRAKLIQARTAIKAAPNNVQELLAAGASGEGLSPGAFIERFASGIVPAAQAAPPPTAEQRRIVPPSVPAAQPALAAPVLKGELMPAAGPNGDLIEKRMYGNTAIYKNNLMPAAQAKYGKAIYSDTAEGATRQGLDQAIREKGQTIPTSMLSSFAPGNPRGGPTTKAEADLALAQKWYSLKTEERGRMPDYVAEALGVPYARPETQDQAWAAAQRQQATMQAQAEQARQAKLQEEIVKGEYGVKAAEAKAKDEASKYKITEQQNEWDPEGPPITKVERQGRGEPPTLMPQRLPGSGLPPKVLNTIPLLKGQSPERRKTAINLMLNDFKDNPEQLTILQQLLKESGLLE